MTDEQNVLSRRAVACKGWRQLPGMLALPSEGMISTPVRLTEESDWPHDVGLRLPDLTDPATVGCLLALVREAWGTAIIVSYSYDDGLWETMWEGATAAGWCGRGDTEAEALVAALECAP